MKANACQFFIICGMANRICTKIETTVTNILRDHQTFIGKLYQRVAPAAVAFVSEKDETSVGELPSPGSLYSQRFGGLNIEQEVLSQFIR
ncbi:phenylacetic acid degradation protein PaaX [Escherichia coli]|nr:phenylacetic acid degradation protein PaaX [Escherichia coli]